MTGTQEKKGEDDLRYEDKLDFSRKDMMNALELFFSHTKYTITLLTAILAASLGVAAFSFDKLQGEESKAAMFIAAMFFLFMGPVAYISYRLVGRYYRLYVSCYIYAVRLHAKYSSIEHPWFVLNNKTDDFKPEDINKHGIVSDVINDKIVNFPADGGRNSWYFYQWLIFTLGTFGIIAGVFLLGWLLARQ